jgi:hypothetical protein
MHLMLILNVDNQFVMNLLFMFNNLVNNIIEIDLCYYHRFLLRLSIEILLLIIILLILLFILLLVNLH